MLEGVPAVNIGGRGLVIDRDRLVVEDIAEHLIQSVVNLISRHDFSFLCSCILLCFLSSVLIAMSRSVLHNRHDIRQREPGKIHQIALIHLIDYHIRVQ